MSSKGKNFFINFGQNNFSNSKKLSRNLVTLSCYFSSNCLKKSNTHHLSLPNKRLKFFSLKRKKLLENLSDYFLNVWNPSKKSKILEVLLGDSVLMVLLLTKGSWLWAKCNLFALTKLMDIFEWIQTLKNLR